jgi:hypothetical protein
VRITAHCRANCQTTANDLENVFDYAGIGIAMLTLIDSTARATIRHSDSEPIASEAATASISLDEATGAERPLKPKAPGDRFMARDPSRRCESPRNTSNSAGITGNIAAVTGRKTAKWRRGKG